MPSTISREYLDLPSWKAAATERGLRIVADPTGDNGRPVAWAVEIIAGKPKIWGKFRQVGIDANGRATGVQGWLKTETQT